MFPTPVPEAAVNEHRELKSWKHEVGPSHQPNATSPAGNAVAAEEAN